MGGGSLGEGEEGEEGGEGLMLRGRGGGDVAEDGRGGRKGRGGGEW